MNTLGSFLIFCLAMTWFIIAPVAIMVLIAGFIRWAKSGFSESGGLVWLFVGAPFTIALLLIDQLKLKLYEIDSHGPREEIEDTLNQILANEGLTLLMVGIVLLLQLSTLNVIYRKAPGAVRLFLCAMGLVHYCMNGVLAIYLLPGLTPITFT